MYKVNQLYKNSKMGKKIKNYLEHHRTNSNNVNKGQPIYYKNTLYYIVYEFDDNVIISSNKDLSKAYCVKKSLLSIKPKK